MSKLIAIIPARGGSKRIPKKNIKDFFGKPLIAYSIELALKSELFDKVIVSTDDEDIANIARQYGAEVPFVRPPELSDDFTGTSDVINHTIEFLKNKGEEYDYICTIYATAPLLQEKYLKEGFEKLKESDAINAFSCTEMPFPIQRTFKITPDEKCEMFTPEHYLSRSQDLEKAYQDAGQFYWTKLNKESKELMFGKDSIPIVLPRYLVCDIDTFDDWSRSEYMYRIIKKDVKMSKYKNVLIRTNSSFSLGLGHIKRDLVLASQFKNSNITFAVEDLEGNINNEILKLNYNMHVLKSNNIDELIKLINKKSFDLVIIDSYDINYDFEKELKYKTNSELMVLDDTYERHYCDILLNHNIYAKNKKYSKLVPIKCKLMCGSKYTLLREEFKREKLKKRKKIKNNKKTSVFISMGGTDHSNINIKILKVLKSFDDVIVRIVTTKSNKNLKELKEYVKNKRWIKLYINSETIAKLMRKSDFAIVSPSVTLNEIYFMKVPFIAIKTARNQINMFNYLLEKKFKVLDEFNKDKLKISIIKLKRELN